MDNINIIEKEKKLPPGVSNKTWGDIIDIKEVKHEILYFRGLAHFIKAVDHGINNMSWDKRHIKDDDEGPEWTYGSFKNYSICKEKLINAEPNEEVLKEIERLRSKALQGGEIKRMMEKGFSLRKHRVFSDSGDELDIDRIMCGDPNHWMKMKRGSKRNIVKIGVNIGLSSGNKEIDFARIGALASVTADLLSRAGMSVEVICIDSAHHPTSWSRNEMAIMFPIKRADEPLELYKIASIGAPGLLRAFGFSVARNCYEGEAESGMGSASATTEYFKKHLDVQYFIEKKWIKDGKEVEFIESIFKDLAAEKSAVLV